jgi:hypothetical protein
LSNAAAAAAVTGFIYLLVQAPASGAAVRMQNLQLVSVATANGIGSGDEGMAHIGVSRREMHTKHPGKPVEVYPEKKSLQKPEELCTIP